MKEIRTDDDYVGETIFVESQDWKVLYITNHGDRRYVHIRPVGQGDRDVFDRMVSMSEFERIWEEQQREDVDHEDRRYGE